MTGPRVIYWFRTDLRLHDSPALKAALDLKPEVLYPIWTWDPHYVYRARVGPNRWRFLIDSQNDLSTSITKLNPKSKLFVIREAPQTLFPKLLKAWRITHLVFEKDTDAYAKERDEKIVQIAKDAGVEVIIKAGRTLYDSDELVKANHDKPTMSIYQVQQAGKKLGDIPRPIPAPKSLPDPGDTTLAFEQEQPSPEPDINALQRNAPEQSYHALAGPTGDFAPPTMEELGLKPATSPIRGGETHALGELDRIIADEDYTTTFAKPNTAPTAYSPQSTTLLSPHLHFGTLSVRLFYWRAQDVVSRHKNSTQPPTSLTGQLLFRDMYFGAQAALGYHFGQTFGNSHCRFIPWHLPSVVDTNNGLITGRYTIDDPKAEECYRRWKEGRTGFPWIDALMRQLKLEGWIHHLGRHAVACFLTRGGCYIDWERGAEVFEEWLIDHEAASNIGNWQWLSCTAFYSQFYRCYSPIAFPQKWDKEGKFVRRFVPELEKFPDKYIYEPWKAPIQDQKLAGCLIKGSEPGTEGEYKTYPKPMFDFPTQRDVCLKSMKKAYEVGLYGNDPRVMNGTWRQLFPDDAEGPTQGKGGLPGAMIKGEERGADFNGHDDGTHADDNESGYLAREAEEKARKGPVTHKRGASQGSAESNTSKRVTRSSAGASSGSKSAAAGHKRGASQSTLDGFAKKAKR